MRHSLKKYTLEIDCQQFKKYVVGSGITVGNAAILAGMSQLTPSLDRAGRELQATVGSYLAQHGGKAPNPSSVGASVAYMNAQQDLRMTSRTDPSLLQVLRGFEASCKGVGPPTVPYP
jgi:hypothetical protein